MNDNALLFELFSILLLLGLGTTLLLINMPGWGLISIAALLAGVSYLLRRGAVVGSEVANQVSGH
ncbi:hypothetical protein [uncultured Neptuniibacter sp.]|uniref:hypothetical protein n=1 Tax=uncultured Neptuniibacter sp. TaxID=502143 RepID=UPI0026134D77|nr:hypothetical protein [uncultured Neptuniibacter sp.]